MDLPAKWTFSGLKPTAPAWKSWAVSAVREGHSVSVFKPSVRTFSLQQPDRTVDVRRWTIRSVKWLLTRHRDPPLADSRLGLRHGIRVCHGALPICAGTFRTWSAPSEACTDDGVGIVGYSFRRFGVQIGEPYTARPVLIRSSSGFCFPTFTFVLRTRPPALVSGSESVGESELSVDLARCTSG